VPVARAPVRLSRSKGRAAVYPGIHDLETPKMAVGSRTVLIGDDCICREAPRGRCVTKAAADRMGARRGGSE